MSDILSALTKFTKGLQEVREEIAGLGECKTLMQAYSAYAQTLWDPEKQIKMFKDLCRDGGDLDLLDLLLGNETDYGTGGVDPSLEDNYGIRIASYNGHHLIVERLLQDSRVNPSADANYAIRYASCYGHHLVADRLLQDGRVDPSVDDNWHRRHWHDAAAVARAWKASRRQCCHQAPAHWAEVVAVACLQDSVEPSGPESQATYGLHMTSPSEYFLVEAARLDGFHCQLKRGGTDCRRHEESHNAAPAVH